MRLYAILDSGSESEPDPAPGTRGSQFNGKFRLRSTPFAFPRVPRAKPSGFRFGTIHRSTPAHWFPWTQPKTSTFLAAFGSPTSTARIDRPCTDLPRLCLKLPTKPARTLVAPVSLTV